MRWRTEPPQHARLSKQLVTPNPSFVGGEDSDHEAYKTSSVKIRPDMFRTRCVKFLSLDLGPAAFLHWLELSDRETEGPSEMAVHHLAGP